MKFKLREDINETEQIISEDLEKVVEGYDAFVNACHELQFDLTNVGAEDIAGDIDSYFLYYMEDMDMPKRMKWLKDDIKRFIYGEEDE